MPVLLGIAAGAALPLCASLGLGRLAWRGRAPHWTLEFASGSALLSTLLFLLLVAGWAHPLAVIPLCLAAAAPLGKSRPVWRRPGLPPWLISVPLAYGFYYLIHALAPEIQPDAAGYHLGLVAEWARHYKMPARIGFYELIPLGMETLFYPAFLIGGHSAAKLVHFACFLMSVPLISWIGEKCGLNSTASFCAAGLYFLTPVAAISGACAYNDAAAAFYPLAASAALLHARETPGAAFHGGLAAGFAYAVKMPGAIAAAAALLWAFFRAGRRAALLCAAAAALCAGPWLARNAILTGNPFAPLGNRIFPNDHFHAETERLLAKQLATYESVTPPRALRALAWDGTELQGLVGPALLVLPASFLAVRHPGGRLLLAAALVLWLPWTRNIGARFLLPSLPFFFLALSFPAGARGMKVLLLLQAVLVSPWALDLYTGPHAWRLRDFPLRAALRVEPEPEYLSRRLYEYPFAQEASRLANGERILDLYGLPFAYMRTVPLGPLPSAEFDNAAIFLTVAAGRPERVATLRAALPPRFYRAVRIRLEKDWPGAWSIHDVFLEFRGRRFRPSRHWSLAANPNPGDARYAIDGNPATRWFTWEEGRAGAWWQVEFTRPLPLDAVGLRTLDAQPLPPVTLLVERLDGRVEDFTSQWKRVGIAQRQWRREATAYLYRTGLRWIAVPLHGDGYGRVARSLRDFPASWGVRLMHSGQGLALFRIEPPPDSR
ncbi:MAG: discoidin domain-containing protein [Bryobacteraceae bacterium]